MTPCCPFDWASTCQEESRVPSAIWSWGWPLVLPCCSDSTHPVTTKSFFFSIEKILLSLRINYSIMRFGSKPWLPCGKQSDHCYWPNNGKDVVSEQGQMVGTYYNQTWLNYIYKTGLHVILLIIIICWFLYLKVKWIPIHLRSQCILSTQIVTWLVSCMSNISKFSSCVFQGWGLCWEEWVSPFILLVSLFNYFLQMLRKFKNVQTLPQKGSGCVVVSHHQLFI